MKEKELKKHRAVMDAVKDFEFKVGDKVLYKGELELTIKELRPAKDGSYFVFYENNYSTGYDNNCTKIWNEGELMEMLDNGRCKWERKNGMICVDIFRPVKAGQPRWVAYSDIPDRLTALLLAAIYVLTGEEWKEGE